MDCKKKCGLIKELLLKIYHTENQCYCALYIHRIYLNIENLIEFYLFKNKISIEHNGAYHKMILQYFFMHLADNGIVCKKLHTLLEELRKFRHIFVKRSDIWCFDQVKLDNLKFGLLNQHDDFVQFIEGIFYEL
ncbi:hypothetical protein MHK_005969 [Candidatus Magnetomorum sp. HK-1]|nr:hypothetical protein MHK_005969 [Candidatus Magnetomorum sp. HK-1]